MSTFNTQLVIEGMNIDLTDNFDGSITYAISDIQNIGNITSNYSKTITVPGSSGNNKAFNYLFNIKNSNDNTTGSLPNIGSNFDFKKKARAYVLQDQQVILHGYAQLIASSTIKGVTSYQLNIVSDLAGLVSDLGDGRLEDLFNSGSSTPFDHVLNLANITGSWNQSSSDAADTAALPFLYPIADYGDYDTMQGVNFYSQNLRPAIYAKKLFDLCLASASYSYSSSFLSGSSWFQGMVIPYKDGQMISSTTDLVFADALNPASLVITQSNSYNTAPAFVYNQNDLPLYSGSRFTPTQGALYNFNVNLNYDLHLHVNYTGSKAVNFFNNTPISIFAYIPLFDSSTNVLVNSTNHFTYTINENTIPIASFNTDLTLLDNNVTLNGSIYIPFGQYAKVGISVNNFYIDSAFIGVKYSDGTVGYTAGSGSLSVNTVSSTNMSINFQSNLDGSTITLNQIINKDVKQIDYVTSILQLFNLMAVVDKDEPKKFNIFQFDEFYQNTKPVLDWTDRIDTDQEILVTPISQLSSQNILLSYRPDTDYYNTLFSGIYGNGVYGQARINTGYSYNTDTLDVLSNNIFSPTVPVQYKQEFQPSEVTCEILSSSRDTIQVSGYYSQISSSAGSPITSSAGLSTSGVFTKAREGGIINYWGASARIKKVINQSQFMVTDLSGNPIVLNRPAGGINTTYYAENDSFQYIGDNNKIFPAIYSTSDKNVTRQPTAVNPRILYYQGLKPCNNWTLQYTPQVSNTSLTASYFQIPYKVTQSVYPVISHLDDYSNPQRDLLFEAPNNLFFPEPGQYPTKSLFTDSWQNYMLQITDEDAKLLTANLKLSSIDIATLDMSQRINIDGTFFRINQVIDYNPDEDSTTKVELLRSPFQVYAPLPSTGSAILSFLSASATQTVSSSINIMTVNGLAPSFLTGSNIPIIAGENGLFALTPTGSSVLVLSLSSSLSTDVINITDGSTTLNQNIAFGSSVVTSSKNFTSGNTVYASISSRIPCVPSVTLMNNGPIAEPSVTAVTLSGSAAGCNGSSVTSSLYTFVSGPITPTITAPGSINTTVTGLTNSGSYVFNLKVVASDGQTANTNTTVTVTQIPLVTIQNGTSTGAISGVNNIAGFSGGSVSAGTTVTGNHSSFTSGIQVTFAVPSSLSTQLDLFKNGSLLQSISITAGSGANQTFSSATFGSTDILKITWS